MRRSQTIGQGVTAAGNALRSGDQGGSGHSIDLTEGD
jgi:type IV secretory pathway TrbL component